MLDDVLDGARPELTVVSVNALRGRADPVAVRDAGIAVVPGTDHHAVVARLALPARTIRPGVPTRRQVLAPHLS